MRAVACYNIGERKVSTMKILFLFTGGTIGSSVSGEHISLDPKMSRILLQKYAARYEMPFDAEAEAPYTALSENNTGETLTLLCKSVRAALARGYDGIVVTHGTDTLQYSAAALSYTCADAKIPICLVSADYPLEDTRTNGIDNLRGAIRFITEVGTPGVFVPYCNKGDVLRVHRGTRLLPSSAFSADVRSVCDSYYGSFLEGEPFLKNPAYREVPDEMAAIPLCTLDECAEKILRIEPCPGNLYPDIPAGVRYILHGSYHSGTVNTESVSARRFFACARSRGIPVFLTGASDTVGYESTRAFGELGIVPLCDISPISAYIKLWLLSAHAIEVPVCQEMLLSPLSGDRIV